MRVGQCTWPVPRGDLTVSQVRVRHERGTGQAQSYPLRYSVEYTGKNLQVHSRHTVATLYPRCTRHYPSGLYPKTVPHLYLKRTALCLDRTSVRHKSGYRSGTLTEYRPGTRKPRSSASRANKTACTAGCAHAQGTTTQHHRPHSCVRTSASRANTRHAQHAQRKTSAPDSAAPRTNCDPVCWLRKQMCSRSLRVTAPVVLIGNVGAVGEGAALLACALVGRLQADFSLLWVRILQRSAATPGRHSFAGRKRFCARCTCACMMQSTILQVNGSKTIRTHFGNALQCSPLQ